MQKSQKLNISLNLHCKYDDDNNKCCSDHNYYDKDYEHDASSVSFCCNYCAI